MAERNDASAADWATAPAELALPDHVAHVWCFRLGDGAAALAPLLSADERERAARLVEPRDRTHFTVARASLRRILARYIGCAAAEVRFAYCARGKPALAGTTGPVQFNLSHAGNLGCVAVTRAGDVGVDVEPVRALGDRDEIAERFFSRREHAALQRWAPALRDRGFFRCWTLKEAYVKALGSGLTHPLDAFDIDFDEDTPPRLVAERGRPPGAWSLHAFTPAPCYVGAVAVHAPRVQVALFRLDTA